MEWGGGRFLLDPELGAAECLQPHSQTETTDGRMAAPPRPLSVVNDLSAGRVALHA